jgi:hypothetical protein
MEALVRFLGMPATLASRLPNIRMTPAEVHGNQTGSEQIGSSFLDTDAGESATRRYTAFLSKVPNDERLTVSLHHLMV